MTKMSLVDEIKTLFEVSFASKQILIVIVLLLFLAYIFFSTNKKNLKTGKKIYLGICAFILLYILIIYHSSIGKMMDYMMDNFFIAFYFPNLAIYFAAIIVTNMILWVSVFRQKTTKIIKNINIIIYCILHYILILLLNTIHTNKLDVFKQSSIYGNVQAQGLIGLSSTIFLLWIIFLSIYKLIRMWQTRGEEPNTIIIEKRKRILPDNIKEIRAPRRVRKEETKIVKNLNNQEENAKNQKELAELDSLLTVEDYKLLLKILSDHKKKEQQEKKVLEELEKEQEKYQELQGMYKR